MARKGRRSPEQQAAAKRMAQRLDALYAELPPLECKGLCQHSCVPVDFAPGERSRIQREAGVDLPTREKMLADGHTACPALVDGRCSVHPVRPLICRLWGIDEVMRCPYGCRPEGGWLERMEGHRLSMRTYLIAGWPPGLEPMTPKEVMEYLRSDETKAIMAEAARRAWEKEPEKPASQKPAGRGRKLRWKRPK